ncbi:DUF1653 domain-containing protein [Roseovarius sp.]
MSDVFEPVRILSLDAPVGSTWEHFRSGGIYRIVGHALIESDLTPAIIYESLSGGAGLWVRPADEFLDGRFFRQRKDR